MKALKLLPSVDQVLLAASAKQLAHEFGRETVKTAVQAEIDRTRNSLLKESENAPESREELLARILERVEIGLQARFAPSLRPVINATGIVLHTGLGRAPFSEAARDNIKRVMQGYANIELDLDTGKRGERTDHIRHLLTALTGAEDALVVNNNAAATLLSLNTLAFGKEAIISRGQLVEIGGSFRIPDVMEKSGVIMREVGTTNKTKPADYENAINDKTGAIVVAHTSNYRVMGFTHEVELAELCELAHRHNLPVLHDLGGGVLVDLREYGLPYEPLVQDSLAAGADVVTFSGDKVLGGPQSGLIVGKKDWLQKIHNNPIMRAVRVDKLIYAGLEATLKHFFSERGLADHTTLQLLREPAASIRQRARAWLDSLPAALREAHHFEIVDCYGQVGSGALPLDTLPSSGVAISSPAFSASDIASGLRRGEPPVIGYIQDDKVMLDFRTIFARDFEILKARIERVLGAA